MSSSRKSIIRNTDRRSGPKKRLSFAPSPDTLQDKQKKKTREEGNSDVSQSGSILVPPDLSCRMTSFGICYDHKAIPRRTRTEYDTVSMKECHRNNFTSALNFFSLTGSTANVLIVGEKFFGEKLKAYLLEMHQKQHTVEHLNWKLDLNIKCEKTLTPVMTPPTHFIIFLLIMETHESIMHLSRIIEKFTEDTLPNKRTIIVTVSSAQGYLKNVVALDQLHALLRSCQLVDFPWKEQGRLGQIDVKRILEHVYKSIGYHRGTSLLMDYAMHLTIDSLTEEEVQH